jgi:iron complex transport system ATP-binding protein
MLAYKKIKFKRADFKLEIPSSSFKKGEKIAIMGENGSGKTTFLHIVSGIIENKFTFIDEIPLKSIDYKKRAEIFAFLPQFSSVFFPFKVMEVVSFGQFVRSKIEIACIDKALQQMDILHLKNRDFTSLSGGEKRRVMIARVLVQNPPIFLLDEPVSMLDIRHSMEILDFFSSLDKTVVASMHDINMAIKFFERFIFLKNGKQIADVKKNEITKELLREVFGVKIIDNNGVFDFKL